MRRILKHMPLYALLCFFAGLLVLQIPKVGGAVTEFAIQRWALPAGVHLKIDRINGAFPVDITIPKLTLKDHQGTFLDIHGLKLSWRFLDLLLGKITIDEIAATDIALFRIPELPSQSKGKPSAMTSLTPKTTLEKAESQMSKPDDTPMIPTQLLRRMTIHTLKLSSISLAPYGISNLRLEGDARRNDSNTHAIQLALFHHLSPPSPSEKPSALARLTFHMQPDACIMQLQSHADTQQLYALAPYVHTITPTGHMALDLNIAFTPQLIPIQGSIRAHLKKLSLVSPILADVVGDTLNLDLVFDRSSSDGIKLESAKILTASGLNVHGTQTAPTNVHISLRHPLLNIRGQADLIWSPQKSQVSTDNLSLRMDGLTLNGNISAIRTSGFTVDTLAARLDAKELSYVTQLFGFPVQGDCRVDFKKEQEAITATFNSDNLAYASYHITGLTGEATYTPEASQLKASATKGTLWERPFHLFRIDATQKGPHAHASFIASGDTLTCGGEVESRKHFQKIILHQLYLTIDHTPWIRLESPIECTQYNHHLHVSPMHWELLQGTLQSTELVWGETLSGTVEVEKIQLRTLHTLLFKQIQLLGTVSGALRLAGAQHTPHIKADIHVRGLKVHDPLHTAMNALNCDLTIERTPEHWSLRSVLNPAQKNPFHAGIQILSTSFLPAAQDQLNGTVKGQLNLSDLTPFIWWGDRVKGMLEPQVELSGTVGKPTISGDCVLRQGYYENGTYGLILHDILVKLNLTPDTLHINTFTARDFDQGRIRLTGNIRRQEDGVLIPHVSITSENLMVVNNDLLALLVSGRLQAQPGSHPGSVHVSGRLTVPAARVLLDESAKTAKNIVTIDLNSPAHTALRKTQEPETADTPSPHTLDVSVSIPDQFVVLGYGLTSRWEGNIHARGPIDKIRVEGKLSIEKGKLDVIGKTLLLSDSSILLDGIVPDIVPYLSIQATRSVGEHDLGLHIRGTANNPEIEFISTPTLSQEEIVSLLLFGKPLNTVSTAQSFQIATSLATLKSSSGSQRSVLSQINQAFGIDEFGITSKTSSRKADPEEGEEQEAGYALRVGKQLTDHVFVALEQGLRGEADTEAIIEIDVTKNTHIDLSAGSEQSTLGYTWEKRY